MINKSFALQVADMIAATRGKRDLVIRATLASVDRKVVARSPVGNPSLWKSNSDAVLHNKIAAQHNFEMRDDPGNLTKNGRLKRGLKMNAKKMGKPAGYAGGRFRGNWQLSIGAPAVGNIDQSTTSTENVVASHASVLSAATIGEIYYLTNNLPYAIPLENGHSGQAPAGIVGITVLEFQQIVDEAAHTARGGTSESNFKQGWETYKL